MPILQCRWHRRQEIDRPIRAGLAPAAYEKMTTFYVAVKLVGLGQRITFAADGAKGPVRIEPWGEVRTLMKGGFVRTAGPARAVPDVIRLKEPIYHGIHKEYAV